MTGTELPMPVAAFKHVEGFLRVGMGDDPEFFPPMKVKHLKGCMIAWDRNIGRPQRRVKIIYDTGTEVVMSHTLVDAPVAVPPKRTLEELEAAIDAADAEAASDRDVSETLSTLGSTRAPKVDRFAGPGDRIYTSLRAAVTGGRYNAVA